MVRVIVGVVEPLQYLEGVAVAVESHREVGILRYPAPAASFCPGAPHDDVIAGEVVVVVVEVHCHQVDEFTAVHPRLVFSHRVSFFRVESLEPVVVLPVAFLQVPPVLYQVDVFEAVVVGIDIMLVGSLADVEHAVVLTVDIDDGGLPGLPVEVGMGGHRALDDGITHIEVVEVVAGIAEHDRLEIGQSGFLVGEEFVGEPFGAEPFVGVEGHRLLLRSS